MDDDEDGAGGKKSEEVDRSQEDKEKIQKILEKVKRAPKPCLHTRKRIFSCWLTRISQVSELVSVLLTSRYHLCMQG
jgi:hypothetical protein